jgi:hypothetical protein
MSDYGYRDYAPGMGRWASRDPIGAFGGPNHCMFVRNSPVNLLDILGLFSHSHDCSAEQLTIIKQAESTAKIAIKESKDRLNAMDTALQLSMTDASHLSTVYAFAPALAPLSYTEITEIREWFQSLIGLLGAVTLTDNFFTFNSYGVECECTCRDYEGEHTIAYVNKGPIQWGIDDDIHFCPEFFAPAYTPLTRAIQFQHEASHWPFFADTIDLSLSTSPPHLLFRDAYFIQSLGHQGESMLKNVLIDNWGN